MISMIQGEVVTRHEWLSSNEFTDIIAISQMTPGPIGINSATYVGYSAVVNAGYSHAVGILGSTIATVSVVLPSFILMVLISKFFLKYQKHPIIASVFEGLRPGVVGLLAAAALVLMNRENFGTYNWQILTSIILFAGTFIASYRYKVNPILLIVICGIIGYVTFGYILSLPYGRVLHINFHCSDKSSLVLLLSHVQIPSYILMFSLYPYF